MRNASTAIEKILWSIALPGFGQLLNGQFAKGVLLILIELLINIKANLNSGIILSFYGNTDQAVAEINYFWLMFYPCVYTFAIWDALKFSAGEVNNYSFLPFVLSAYLGTVGVIYSPTFKLFGVLLGPIWLPIIFLLTGALGGIALLALIKKLRCCQ